MSPSRAYQTKLEIAAGIFVRAVDTDGYTSGHIEYLAKDAIDAATCFMRMWEAVEDD